MDKNQRKIAVVICSVGRPKILAELLPHLIGQSRLPDSIHLVVTKSEDVDEESIAALPETISIHQIISEKGLTKQRNAGLDAITGHADYVVFFDDDFVPSFHTLEGIIDAFEKWPKVNGLTGYLIADGINGKGFSDAKAKELIDEYDALPRTDPGIIKSGLEGLYGCNMAYRMSAVGDIRFDETLPLYGWQEDIDFAARIPGERIKTDAFAGVHRGAKTGRETSGARLGYSQIVNPWYLWRKGSMTGRFARRLAFRNVVANHLKVFRPEPWVDRRGRAIGNWIALWHIVTARAEPNQILKM